MNYKKKILLQSMHEFLEFAQTSIDKLQKELQIVTFERDMYRQIILESDTDKTNELFLAIYSKDIGEGYETQSCIGVFSLKSIALKAILQVSRYDHDINISQFHIEPVPTQQYYESGHIVPVVMQDILAHRREFTRIIGIRLTGKITHNAYCQNYIIDEIEDVQSHPKISSIKIIKVE